MRILQSTIALSALVASQASAQVINEIRIDAAGLDDQEFIEIAGTPDQTLTGVHLVVIGDGTAGSGVLEEVVDLGGLTFDANGLITIAEEPFVMSECASEPNITLCRDLVFENNDNVTFLLVTGLVANKGDDLDDDDDGVLNETPEPWAAVLDRIAVIEVENPPPPGEEFHYGPPVIGPIEVDGVDKSPGHVYLCPDIGWQVGPFDFAVGEDTPGAANPCPVMGPDAGPGDPDASIDPTPDASVEPMPDAGFGAIPESSLTPIDQPGIFCRATRSSPLHWAPLLLALAALVGRRRRRS